VGVTNTVVPTHKNEDKVLLLLPGKMCGQLQRHQQPQEREISQMSSSGDHGEVVIIGAGLVGSLLAYLLQKRGYSVTLYERYQDIRQIPSLGRSINLVITRRGLRAVDSIGGGLREELLSLGVRVTGRTIHQMDGSVQFQRYGKDDNECNYSISRYELNKFLIQKSESAGAKIYFGHELDADATYFAGEGSGAEGDVGSVLNFKFNNNGTASTKEVRCRCPVIACDGGGSRARYAMRKDGLLEFTESLLGTET
jgi:kynurenine 3-monooxygenase